MHTLKKIIVYSLYLYFKNDVSYPVTFLTDIKNRVNNKNRVIKNRLIKKKRVIKKIRVFSSFNFYFERMVFFISISDNKENIYFVKYDNNYLEQYDELFMIMYVYLHRYRSIEGYVNITIKDFILYYNFTPNRNKGRINQKIYNTLQLMIDKEFIRYIGCFSNGGLASLSDVDCNMMFTVQLINIDDKWNPQSRFTKILYSEIDRLKSNNIKSIDKILCLYMNIKKRISSDVDAATANPFAYPSEETLARECNCGLSSIKNYTHVLCDIGMLYVKNYGSYMRMKKGKEIVMNSNNVYALEEKYLNNNAMEALREYLKLSCGYIDGFYPFCDNLHNNKLEDDFDVDVEEIESNNDIWGEPDPMEKDYSIEEILEMNTVVSVQSEDKKMNNDKELFDIESLYETDESLMDLY